MAARERVLIVLGLVVLVYPLYIPLSHVGAERAYAPAIWIDHQAPLWPGWMWAYFGVYTTALMPVAVVRCPQLYRRVALAYLATMIVSFNIFWLFPVRMTLRPVDLAVDSFASWGLRLTYHLDQPLNCFPSLHVGMAVLAALSCWKADRLWGAIVWLFALAICLSTMLVKQHFFVDVVGGFSVALLAFRLFVHPADVSQMPADELRFPRHVGGYMVGAYLLFVAVMYGIYRTGWAPWR